MPGVPARGPGDGGADRALASAGGPGGRRPAGQRADEDLPLVVRQRRQHLAVHPVDDLLARRAATRAPSSVTAMIRARRSVASGRRSARPARSSSSTVTTIVVLSMSPQLGELDLGPLPAQRVVQHAVPARVSPISASAAAIRVRSTWLVWSSR